MNWLKHLLELSPCSAEHEARIHGEVTDIEHDGPKGAWDMAKYYREQYERELFLKALERIDALEVRVRELEKT